MVTLSFVMVIDGDHRYYVTSSWYNVNKKTGNRSVTQWAEPYYAEPKNIGRANETTNETQALAEYNSMVQKERDKRLSEKPLPMLAQPFGKRKSKIKYPAYVQPKYDGMRMLFNGEEGWSRGNKPIIPEVIQHLQFNTDGAIIDGELILPDNPKVNEVMKAAKKYREGVSDKLVYRVYDIVDTTGTLTFRERFAILAGIVFACDNENVILAMTHEVANEEDVAQWHSEFTESGFEGTMIRNANGIYAVNKRTDDLQKHKDFIDGEFLIIDVIPAGGGSSADVGKFKCINEAGDDFESTPIGTLEERREYLTNKQNYIGKYAKVKYRETSGARGVPFHSNVLEIRDTKEGGY